MFDIEGCLLNYSSTNDFILHDISLLEFHHTPQRSHEPVHAPYTIILIRTFSKNDYSQMVEWQIRKMPVRHSGMSDCG